MKTIRTARDARAESVNAKAARDDASATTAAQALLNFELKRTRSLHAQALALGLVDSAKLYSAEVNTLITKGAR